MTARALRRTDTDLSPPVSGVERLPAGETTMLKVSGLSKSFLIRDATASSGFRRQFALDSIDATVKKGEMITLLGPSGCGKTTLLRIAAGLTRCDQGLITINGEAVTRPRKDACMVFQHFGLLPWRTLLANVEFPLELDGMKPQERRARAHATLALVGLERFASYFPHEVSGGMQQRVGIARALMRNPLVLFMDEPFGALDAQTREQLQEDFLKIWSATGATVLFVTHSIDEALVLSDRIFVFTPSPGRIKAVVTSPLAPARAIGDVRMHPEYAPYRAKLRSMLQGLDS